MKEITFGEAKLGEADAAHQMEQKAKKLRLCGKPALLAHGMLVRGENGRKLNSKIERGYRPVMRIAKMEECFTAALRNPYKGDLVGHSA